MSNSASLTEYEKIRLENIARNEKYLQDIGLGSAKPDMRSATVHQKKKRKVDLGNEPNTSTRRSLRIAEIPIMDHDLDSAGIEDDDEEVYVQKARKPSTTKVTARKPPPSADSTRSLNVQLDVFLGNKIGTLQCEVYGKAAIMEMLNGGSLPKFSKYSGVVEWKNCVQLWVNIGGTDGYTNSFMEKGRYMTWYGGSKHTEDSEVIQRLLKSEKRKETVVLFVRLPKEPYCCLGELAMRKAAITRHPIEIEFELLDFERLKKVEQFQRVLKQGSL